ncbi:uncharacterized protein C2orf81 homolog [Camelus bactrianus]|uniref:Uncharacterized protein C2orf81 homolog n=1 Tax=Camelus bactrianus TaxID=9837 RepID=A0AC58QTC7_CAMBA
MADKGSRQERQAARNSGTGSTVEKLQPPKVPEPQGDIVPARLTEAEAVGLKAREEGEEVVGDILAERLDRVMDSVFRVYQDRQVGLDSCPSDPSPLSLTPACWTETPSRLRSAFHIQSAGHGRPCASCPGMRENPIWQRTPRGAVAPSPSAGFLPQQSWHAEPLGAPPHRMGRKPAMARLDPASLPCRWVCPQVEVLVPLSTAPPPEAYRRPQRGEKMEAPAGLPASGRGLPSVAHNPPSVARRPRSKIWPSAKWPIGLEAEAKLLDELWEGRRIPPQGLVLGDQEIQDPHKRPQPAPRVLEPTFHVKGKPLLRLEEMKLPPGVSVWNPATQELLRCAELQQEDEEDSTSPPPIQTSAPEPEVTVAELTKNLEPEISILPSKKVYAEIICERKRGISWKKW